MDINEITDLDSEINTEVESKFDLKKWNEFLNDISVKLADCFLNNQVDHSLIK